jgi:hypothetical protein
MNQDDIGKVPSFNHDTFIQAAQILVDADEAERAIELLTNGLPAYYRDNPPREILVARCKIIQATMTAPAYMDCADDSVFCESGERAKAILDANVRGQLMKQSVEAKNKEGVKPHIVDMGSGELWLPIGLKEYGLDFTYEDIIINAYTREKSAHVERTKWDGQAPVIFCALEVIEHLANVKDMAVEMHRHTRGRGAKEIHLSTPMYVYDPKPKPIMKLENNGLPHLRGYTPNEFLRDAAQVFGSEYHWQFVPSQIMSLVGARK